MSDDSPVVTVVRAVAAVSNRDPTEMEPLHRTIDTDALNDLCTPSPDGRDRDEVVVTFVYGDCRVRVTNRGDVSIAPSR